LSKALVSGTGFILAGVLSAGPVAAQGNSQGKGKKAAAASESTTSSGASTTISAGIRIEIGSRDRETIKRYYQQHPAGLPPGLAKRGGDLPPGLDKQLKRNGQLPPGLQKKLEPVPAGLHGQLSRVPSGYNWFVLGAHIVVMNKQKNLIGDFALDIVR
jgi:hypothetical protein